MSYNAQIKDIAEIVMGQSPQAEDVNSTGDGLPLLNGPTEFTSRSPVPVQYTTAGKKFAENDDILFCVRGSTTGRMNYADQKYVIGRGIAAIRGKNGYPTQYVRAVIERNLDRLLAAATGSTFPNIGRDQLLNFEIDTVSLEDAIEVNKLIVSLEDKIELNRQINQTLEKITQTIFKSWFVDFEPVKAKIAAKAAGQDTERAAMCAISSKSEFELDQLSPENYQQLATTAALFPDELEESELGLIPKGWRTVPLYNTANFINGAAFKSSDFSLKNDGLPIVKIAELKSGITSQTKFTSGNFPGKYMIDNDDVLYSWSGSPNTSLEVFKWFGGKGWLNQHIFKVVTDSKSSKYFVFYLLRQLKPQLIAIATDKQTTGLGHVTVADMKRLLIPCPTKALLQRFASVVGPFYEESSCAEKQSISLMELRDILLPKLLSGYFIEESVMEGGDE